MSTPIQKGDVVTLIYVDKILRHMTVIHTPQGEGDSWFIQDDDGDVTLINVYATTFEHMLKEKGEHG